MPENDRPFPLLRRFEQLVLPTLLLSLGLYVWSVYAQNNSMTEQVYVELERTHLQALIDDMLLHDVQLRDVIVSPDIPAKASLEPLSNLQERAAREASLQHYLCLEFVRADGRRLTGVENDPDCRPVEQAVLNQIAVDQRGTLLEDFPRSGIWTVVAPLLVKGRSTGLLAVVTKSSKRVQNDPLHSFKLWAAISFIALSLAIFVAWVLIRRAQKLIDQQVRDLIRLRTQISRYVSGDTVRAVMGSDRNDLPSSRSEMTLLFMDVRGFSSYAETANLDDIVTLLNEVTSIATSAVETHDGDVNKVIGDGLLATFSGDDRQTRALQAAVEIAENITSADYARNVGLGVHDGEVISATIGRGTRRDHTVLGRTVNQASRLCSMAEMGEVIATVDTIPIESAFETRFGSEETVFLKGHSEPLRVRKYKPDVLR